MSEAKGHFERGRWVVDPVPAPEPEKKPAQKAPTVEEQVHRAPGADPSPHMSEAKGHFERGRWVVDPVPAPEPEKKPAQKAPIVEEQMTRAPQPAQKAESAGNRPIDTHDQIEQAAQKAGENLERAINAWAESAQQGLQKR